MTKNGDGSLAWLRHRNRQRVIEILRMQGRISQAAIARATGLSRTTVSTLIAELKESGLVSDVDTKSMGVAGGRPAVKLVLNHPPQFVGGIDFGHSHIQVAVGDQAHNVLGERRCDLDVNHRAVDALDAAAGMFGDVLDELGVERKQVTGVGIGFPGPADRARGTSVSTTVFPGWVGLPLASERSQCMGVYVSMEQ